MAAVKGCVKRSQVQPGQQQAWQAMRILRTFNLPTLLTTCPKLAHRSARRYLARLRCCGYVALAARRAPGQVGSYDTYSLRRNTGPLAPIARKGSVTMYDPNTQDVWGDGGVLMPIDEPAPPKAPPLKPASVRWLALLAHGRRPEGALPDPENTGARAAVLKALRKRDLVDEGGALTDAGRAIGLANAGAIE